MLSPVLARPARSGRALAVVAAIGVVCAGCSAGASGDRQNSPATGAPSATQAAGRPITGTAAATADTLSLVPALQWKRWDGVRVPYLSGFGPANVSGDVATGFDHGPEGALIAMMQEQVRLTLIPSAKWNAAASAEAVTAGTGHAPPHKIPAGLVDPTTRQRVPTYSAFKWVSYTPQQGVAELALAEADGTTAETTVTVDWHGGDWRLELPPAGAPAPKTIPALDGFQPFPGVPG